MRRIYLNYASTAPEQSPRVLAAVDGYLRGGLHLNAGRNFAGLDDSAFALQSRLELAGLFGVDHPSRIIFTSGVTASLNMVLRGILRPGDHVLASSVEHNAVARPLALLGREGGVETTWLRCDPDGTLDPGLVEKSLKNNTRLLVMSHASNVLGTILPVEECFAAAKRNGLMTVLDAAQTAGSLDVGFGSAADVLAFTGHKGLGGLAGIGGFALGKGVAEKIRPWLVGGTGSASDSLEQPGFLPDKFEPGTPNTVGIVSLGAAAAELRETGAAAARAREIALTARFLDGLRGLPVAVCGTGDAGKSVAVVSVNCGDRDPGLLARQLYEEYGIITRSGLHCSPLAHRTAGTFPRGTLRFSFGRGTTPGDIDDAIEALGNLLA